MNRILDIVITVIVGFALLFGLYNFFPLSWIEVIPNTENVGAAITTIQGSDTLRNSRTTINNNFAALNTAKVETSTTTLPLVITLANLTTVGTIGTGTWQGDIVGAQYGGTGSSTLAAFGVLLGNGTGAVNTVAGLGTSGQALVSNGAASAPTWQSVAVNQNDNFTWTGNHEFQGLLTASTTSTVTLAGTNIFNGLTWPSADGTSGQVIETNGSGTLSFQTDDKGVERATTTAGVSISNSASETNLFSYSVPANTLSTTNGYRFTIFADDVELTSGTLDIDLQYGATTVATYQFTGSISSISHIFEGMLLADEGTSAQVGYLKLVGDGNTEVYIKSGTAAIDSTSAQDLKVTAQFSAAAGNNTLDVQTSVIELIN